VADFLDRDSSIEKVVFCCFSEESARHHERALAEQRKDRR